MVKILLRLAALALTLFAGATAQATTFNFSYIFGNGTAVTGSFDGTANGNLVTGLSNISVELNGKAFAGNGSLVAAAFDRDNYSWYNSPVVSFNGLESNFGFANGDINSSYTNVFLIIPYATTTTDFAEVTTPTIDVAEEAGPTTSIQASWHLQAVSPTTTVPEPETYWMLCSGLALMGVVARRRQQS
jgi:hypothetical protein